MTNALKAALIILIMIISMTMTMHSLGMADATGAFMWLTVFWVFFGVLLVWIRSKLA